MSLHISTRADDSDKHASDVTALIYAEGYLYSGGDDGKIKLWEDDLRFIREVDAHSSSIYSLAASDETLYSASNDGTVKAWELDTLKEKGVVVKGEDEFWKLVFKDGKLYLGDNQGVVKVYQDDKLIVEEATCNPIQDLFVSDPYVFSVKDIDVTITEILHTKGKHVVTTKKTIPGKAPVIGIADKFIFCDRSGKDILIHHKSNDLQFNQFLVIRSAHEMIINALSGYADLNGRIELYSGGWDQFVKHWQIVGESVNPIEKVDVNFVVNAIVNGEVEELFAAGGDGHIVRLDVD